MNNGIEHLKQELWISPGRVLWRKLDVITERARIADGVARLVKALLARNPQLVLQMNVRCRKKDMNAWPHRRLKGLRRALNVVFCGARKGGNNGTRHRRRHGLDRSEISIRGNGETSLDDIDSKSVQLASQANLFLHVHAATWGLLTIAQCGVKNRDSRLFHKHSILVFSMLCACLIETKAYNCSK